MRDRRSPEPAGKRTHRTATTKLNPGHVHGRGQTAILVPVLARDEESQPTTQESMFNYVRLSDSGTPSVPGEFRSEVDVVASLAERILPEGRIDPVSKTPAFKSVVARLRAV